MHTVAALHRIEEYPAAPLKQDLHHTKQANKSAALQSRRNGTEDMLAYAGSNVLALSTTCCPVDDNYDISKIKLGFKNSWNKVQRSIQRKMI